MIALIRPASWRQALDSFARKLDRIPEALCSYNLYLYLVVVTGIAAIGILFLLIFPVTAVVALHSLAGATASETFGAFLWPGSVSILAGAFAVWTTVVIARMAPGSTPGRRIDKPEAPILYAEVGHFRDLYRAPAIHQVTVTDTCSMEIRRTPLAGFPLVFVNRLEIGLPLLLVLSPLKIQGMLAGTIGRYSGRYDRISAWLAVQHDAWQRYPLNAAAGLPGWLLRAFASWYVPLYTWMSRPAMRRHQLEFDRCAHDVLSVQDQSEMLATLIVLARFIDERYWPAIWKSAGCVTEPGFMPYANLEHVFRHKLREQDVQRWLREAMSVLDDGVSKTPSLRRRLDQIGQERIEWRYSRDESACEHYLGPAKDGVIQDLDDAWAGSVSAEWKSVFERRQGDRNRFRALEMKLEHAPLHGREAMSYAALARRLGSRQRAIEAHAYIVEMNPNDARINYGAGKYLISVGDAGGVKALERAMELDKRYVDPACRLISEFVVSNRRQSTLRTYLNSVAKAG